MDTHPLRRVFFEIHPPRAGDFRQAFHPARPSARRDFLLSGENFEYWAEAALFKILSSPNRL
jgi:hypothetical protein